MKTIKPIVIVLGLLLQVSANTQAQTSIDVTYEHAKIGRTFANRVWIVTQKGTISLPEIVDLATGSKGQFIEIKFPEPLDKWIFRAKVGEIIRNHSEYINVAGGWSEDENGSSIGFFLLNAKSVETQQEAYCLVLYNNKTGIAVFNTMSSQL